MQRLMVWFGPTSSSKSTGALGMAHRFHEQGRKVILVRPSHSRRDYEDIGVFRTKNGAPWPSYDIKSPDDIITCAASEKPDVIWIDEPALFPEESVSNLPPWLFRIVCELRQHFTILISGIGATSEMEVFGKSLPLLLAVADEIVHCKGDCPWCGRMNVATRTVYIGEDIKITPDKVGGAEVYQPACAECWNEQQDRTATQRKKAMRSGPYFVAE